MCRYIRRTAFSEPPDFVRMLRLLIESPDLMRVNQPVVRRARETYVGSLCFEAYTRFASARNALANSHHKLLCGWGSQRPDRSK